MKFRRPNRDLNAQNLAKKLGEILPDFLSDLEQKMKDPQEEVFLFWREILGEKMAPFTEPISFINGVLTVKVKSTTLYTLLVTHEKQNLLKKLQDKFSIRNLIFRVG